MAMRGWRLIGIIASVIWFFGFGVFLWNQFVEDAVAPYAQDLKICSAIEQYSDEFWQANARDSEELSEKLQVNQDQYEKCASKAKLQWESERPSDSVLAIVVVAGLQRTENFKVADAAELPQPPLAVRDYRQPERRSRSRSLSRFCLSDLSSL